MDCFSLQALGDTSDSLLSETFSNNSNNVSNANSNDSNIENQAKQSDPKQRVLLACFYPYNCLFFDYSLHAYYFPRKKNTTTNTRIV
jgi:hypothetical protein